MRIIETPEATEIDYPNFPEEPMANSQYHFNWILFLADNLQMLFRDQDDRVAVLGDIQWYPVQGNNTITTAPDVMVCFGVPQDRGHNRTSYVQHREGGIGPSVVFEIDSETNTRAEIEQKREWYETYGVEEFYWIFSETPYVHVFIRDGEHLVEQTDISEWTSPLLNIRLDWSTDRLQIFKPDGTLMLPIQQYVIEEKQRADQEAKEKRAALKKVKAETKAKKEAEERAEQERLRAEQEAKAKEEAEHRAELERQKAEQYAEVLRKLGIDPDNLPKS